MPGYVMHVAIAQEYIKKHKNISNVEQFIKGNIEPDMVKPKSLSHYGKSPAYTNLKEFLKNNKCNSDFKKGEFLHLVTDYLFYNLYLDRYSKEFIYNDYDILNESLMKKYNVILPEEVKGNVFYKQGKTEIFNYDLACKVIDEVSDLDLDVVEQEVKNENERWKKYKKLI